MQAWGKLGLGIWGKSGDAQRLSRQTGLDQENRQQQDSRINAGEIAITSPP